MSRKAIRSRFALLALAAISFTGPAFAQAKPPAQPASPPPAQQPAPAASKAAPTSTTPPPAAWRVECAGDGKVLECHAAQVMFQVQNGQQVPVAQFVAQIGADKAPMLLMVLPLGISLTDPVQVKIDNGAIEKYPVQTCSNGGCFVSVPLKDPMLAAMRAGTILKVMLQDNNKRTIDIEVPLLGFGLAFDKATK